MYTFTIENDLEKKFILTKSLDVTIIDPKANKSISDVEGSKYLLNSVDKLYKYEFVVLKQERVIKTSLIEKNYQLNDMPTPKCPKDYEGNYCFD